MWNLFQVFHGDIFHVMNSFLIDDLNLEIRQIDDQPFVNFSNALLHKIMGLFSGHI